jgi:hypothetical protein
MVLFQATENQDPIQMIINERKPRAKKVRGGATAEQKGRAAEMRSWVNENIKGKMNECLFRDLSFIVHSGDKNPSKAGLNPYADQYNRYDPNAEAKLQVGYNNIKQIAALAKKGIFLPPVGNCPDPMGYIVGGGEYMTLMGGKLSTSYIKKFLDASYDKKGKAPQKIGDYERDNSLSGERVSVYYDPKTKDAVVVHRGSQGIHDWGNNLKMALGFNMSNTKRFQHAKDIQKKAEEKYGKSHISTLGHSLGGKIASDVGGDSKEIITLNKATGIGRDAYKKEHGAKENEYNIRSTLDPVSAKGVLEAELTIPSKSLNLVKEHGTGVLDRVETEIGRGFDRKKYEKLTKKQLKDIIKSLPKVKDGFKLTGAGKPILVNYICERCGK